MSAEHFDYQATPESNSGAEVRPELPGGEAQELIRRKESLLPYLTAWLNSSDRTALFNKYGIDSATASPQQFIEFDPLCQVVFVDVVDSTTKAVRKEMLYAYKESRELRYHFTAANNEAVLIIPLSEPAAADNLERESANVKVVKSRPTWMYPQLFKLPPEEVWLPDPNSATMVIGDPYEACDREGVTIIEYEYADEILPAYYRLGTECFGFPEYVNEKIIKQLRFSWKEDLDAVERDVYGDFLSVMGNPYYALMEYCIRTMAQIGAKTVQSGFDHKALELQLEAQYLRAREMKEKLVRGDWTYDEAYEFIASTVDDPEFIDETTLRHFFQEKEKNRAAMKGVEGWTAYKQSWETFFSNLQFPEESTSNLEPRLRRARRLLEQLTTAQASGRIETIYRELMNEFDILAAYEMGTWDKMKGSEIRHARQTGLMDSGMFGFSFPGFTVSARTKRIFEVGLRALEGSIAYMKEVYPRLEQVDTWMNTQRPPGEDELSVPEKPGLAVIETYEQQLIRSLVHKKQATRAVSMHGFFPYRMPEVPPQDRIIALTSVSMHGWNRLDRAQFRADIAAALPYLKPTVGKYILGPINHHGYFGGPDYDFPADELTSALQGLADEGLIDYQFVKMEPDEHSERAARGVDSFDMENSIPWSDDSKVLKEGEVAHSLIIIRLA